MDGSDCGDHGRIWKLGQGVSGVSTLCPIFLIQTRLTRGADGCLDRPVGLGVQMEDDKCELEVAQRDPSKPLQASCAAMIVASHHSCCAAGSD